AVRFTWFERHHRVPAFPDPVGVGINAEADAVAESPDANVPIELPAPGGQARSDDVSIVVEVNGRVDSSLAQLGGKQLLHAAALQLLQIRRFLDHPASNDSGNPHADHINGVARGNGFDLLADGVRHVFR